MPEDLEVEPEQLTRFQQLARALFRVEKKDVPKHEPKKRAPRADRADDSLGE